MNYLSNYAFYWTGTLTDRLRANDPDLRNVSVRTMPIAVISPHEIVSIVTALQHNTHVKSIDLSLPPPYSTADECTPCPDSVHDTEDNDESYTYLCDALRTNCSLDSLTVRVDTDSPPASWKALSRAVSLNTSLRTLEVVGSTSSLDGTLLSTAACRALEHVLGPPCTMERLCLRAVTVDSIDALAALCRGIRHNVTLGVLELNHVDMNDKKQAWGCVFEAVANNAQAPLQRLSIVDCDLDWDDECNGERDDSEADDGSDHPLFVLASAQRLCELKIVESQLGLCELQALCNGLVQAAMMPRTTQHLERLDLSGCDLLADACRPLAVLVSSCPLRHLLLPDNILGDAGVTLLAPALTRTTTLLTLNLQGNHVTAVGCHQLAAALCHYNPAWTESGALRELNLSENAIGDAGAVALGPMLRDSSLHTLQLDGCHLTHVGMASIAQGLCHTSQLRHLNLSNNWCLQSDALAGMLTHNTTLHSLNLSSCHVGNDTLGTLLSSLSGDDANTTLQELYLPFNAFDNRGARYVAHMLRHGRNQLATLSVQFNAIDSVGMRDMVDGLASHYYLQEFFYWNGSRLDESSRSNESHETDHRDDVPDEERDDAPSTGTDGTVQSRLNHWLSLNRAGRRALLECGNGGTNAATNRHASRERVWPIILHRADGVYGPSAVFHLLRERPDLVERAATVQP